LIKHKEGGNLSSHSLARMEKAKIMKKIYKIFEKDFAVDDE
jgi:hypothetical protein